MKAGAFESVVEEAALGWLADPGCAVIPGPLIAPGELAAERAYYEDVVLMGRLRRGGGRYPHYATPASHAKAPRR